MPETLRTPARRRRSVRRAGLIVLVSAGAMIAAGCGSGSRADGTASPSAEPNSITLMTNPLAWGGFTPEAASGSSSISSFYKYYGTLWEKQFPGLAVKEQPVKDMAEVVAKTLLSVKAGNPPDLVVIDEDLGTMVKRGLLTNLDPYFQAAGIDGSTFLPAMKDFATVDGHWYALPAASNPSTGDILYLPAQVKKAGFDPDNPPRTWDDLWQAVQKATTFDSAGNLTRAPYDVQWDYGKWSDMMNLYCGSWATYDPQTARFTANAPCMKDFFSFQKKVVDFYGGMDKWTKFYAGDPQVWSCSDDEYLNSGKYLFKIDAWWSGNQMDSCDNYKQEWRLSHAPTPTGSESELSAIRTTAWMVGIPVGAKAPQHAFDFAKFILWDHGDLLGPTTNGPVVTAQLDSWASDLTKKSTERRTASGAAGQPMQDALTMVLGEAKLGTVARPNSPNNTLYNTLIEQAWQSIAYGKMDVDQALDAAQQQLDAKQ